MRAHAAVAARAGAPLLLDAVVTEVARESREGTFRVELDLVGAGRFPPSHGLTGSVQVTVDRAKPWEYVAQVVTPLLAPRRNDGAQQPQATR